MLNLMIKNLCNLSYEKTQLIYEFATGFEPTTIQLKLSTII